MKKILILEDEIIIANRIKELIGQIKKDIPNFVLLGFCSFEDKAEGIRITNSIQNNLKSILDEYTTQTKSIFLKGRYLQKVRYEDLSNISL